MFILWHATHTHTHMYTHVKTPARRETLFRADRLERHGFPRFFTFLYSIRYSSFLLFYFCFLEVSARTMSWFDVREKKTRVSQTTADFPGPENGENQKTREKEEEQRQPLKGPFPPRPPPPPPRCTCDRRTRGCFAIEDLVCEISGDERVVIHAWFLLCIRETRGVCDI